MFEYNIKTHLPLDYIHGTVSGVTPEQIKEHSSLIFTPFLVDGDVIKYEYAEYDKMNLKIYPSGRMTISGSIHKFANDGGHNSDQFTFDKFLESLEKLYNYFYIQPENINLIGVEYGVNITPPILTSLVLSGCQEHKGKPFSFFSDKHGHYYQSTRSAYWLKIYDKGLQYKWDEQNLRIEIKDKKFYRYRDTARVFTLHDLIRWNKKPLIDNLVNQWKAVTFYDFTMDTDEHEYYSNPNFWKVARANTSRQNLYYHRNRLKKLNKAHSKNVHEIIRQSILDTVNNLRT